MRVNGSSCAAAWSGRAATSGSPSAGASSTPLNGGLIYTDAIDNSAGVDCSDHEVNIKILLDGIVAAGELTTKQRNELLASMTDEVAGLVLANNKAQTLALLMARKQSLGDGQRARPLHRDAGDRGAGSIAQLEFLPSDRQIAERQLAGTGLTAPEFAVLIAYTKNTNVAEMVDSDLPDDPLLQRDLVDYFPTPLRASATPRRSWPTRCAARSSPRSSSTRWSTCRGSPSTTA